MQSSKPPPRPKPLPWSAPSHIVIFVRNLKLLRLDSQEGWPEITVRSLSSSSQNQRQRIKAVEWALYHLVAIWDPAVAQDKLRPFFPPLEPLQSVNLRAALFRVLSELKKNGDLGREIILRKSMLDDCKGDRFDELLASFSTAVLRRALTASTDVLLNPAMKWSTAKGISPEDYQLIVPLILAHNVSLGSKGERRARVRETYDKFSQLLDNKKVQLANRKNEGPSSVSEAPKNFDTLVREVKSNWLGSEEWAETLLYGGSYSSSDAFLELPFTTAWTKANQSTVEDLRADTAQDLLIELESRVSRHRDRLHRWREFSSSIQKTDNPETKTSASTSNNAPLVFRDHQALTLASISKAVRQPASRTSLKEEHQRLLSSMNEALARINGKANSSGRAALPLRVPDLDMPPASDSHDPVPLPERRTESPVVHISPSPASESESESDQEIEPPRRNPTNLLERTRKSMSLLPPQPTTRSRESLAARKPRKSFPVNQFETPRKQPSAAYHNSISRASTPQDDLYNEDAEYSSVFKSRPRVVHSPIASPAVHFSPLEDFNLSGDMEGYEHGDGEQMASPSVRRRF